MAGRDQSLSLHVFRRHDDGVSDVDTVTYRIVS